VKWRSCSIAAALALLVAGRSFPAAAAAITGSQIIDRMQSKLEESKTFSASFEKQFYWAALDRRSSRRGRLFIQRPDRFRLEVDDGDLVVADGRAIWAYSRKNRQVIVSSYAGELKTPWEVLGDFSETYAPEQVEEVKLGDRPCYLLSLKPQTSGALVGQMKVWIDRQRWLPLRVEQLETSENVATYILREHQTDRPIDAALFRFAVPEGVEVIDRRKPDPADE
jgi:outer membrane lipoprotein carrier protein